MANRMKNRNLLKEHYARHGKPTRSQRLAEELWRQRMSAEEFEAQRTASARRAEKLRMVADRTAQQRDSHLEKAAELIITAPNGHMDAEAYRQYNTALDNAERFEFRRQLADSVAKGEERVAAIKLKVSERSVYAPDGPNNYFRDVSLWAIGQQYPTYPGVREARERLDQWKKEQKSWTGKDRRYLERIQVENHSARGVDGTGEELRAPMSTAVGVGGELVPPAWILSQTPVYRPSLCSFESQCAHMDLPNYGVAIQVPDFTAASGVANQGAENAPLIEQDPTTGNLSAGSLPFFTKNVESLSGVLVLSQQQLDRGARTYDPVVGRIVSTQELVSSQLMANLENSRNTYVLTEALSAITQSAITDNGAYSVASFWQDVSQAKQTIATASGTHYRPTHLFMDNHLVDKIEEQLDSDSRPIFTPDWGTMSNADDGDTGYNVQSLRIWRDGSIPTLSGNYQMVVSRPSTVLVLTGTPYIQVFPEELANTLSVVLRLKQYCVAIPLWPNANEVITGSAYPIGGGA